MATGLADDAVAGVASAAAAMAAKAAPSRTVFFTNPPKFYLPVLNGTTAGTGTPIRLAA
jgi:hypothetical protein